MSLDASEVGHVAAAVMEDLERMGAEGEFGTDAKVVACVVVWEVHGSAGLRGTQNWGTLAHGLLERGLDVLRDRDALDLSDGND